MNIQQIAFALSEIERRASELIRWGKVKELDEGKARVIVDFGESQTYWIKWASAAGDTREWRPPSIGEQVMVLSPFGGLAGGLAICGAYQSEFPPPADSKNVWKKLFADGTFIEHDSESHTLSIQVASNGKVEVQCATAEVSASAVTVDSPNATFTGQVTVRGPFVSQGPLSYIAGMTGTGATSISGSVAIVGELRSNGVSVDGHTHPIGIPATGPPTPGT